MSEPKLTISDPCNELFAAMAKAQGEITAAAKDANNPFFKSKYADLASVWDACRTPLSKNGICVVQIPSADGQVVTVTTIIGHASGQKIVGELSGSAKAADPQSVGSVVTYLRRYSLSAMVSVAPEDDDGNAGTGKPEDHQPGRQEPRRQHDRHNQQDAARQAQSGEESQDGQSTAPKTMKPLTPYGEMMEAFVKYMGIGAKDWKSINHMIKWFAPDLDAEKCYKNPDDAQRIVSAIREKNCKEPGMPLEDMPNAAELKTEGAAT